MEERVIDIMDGIEIAEVYEAEEKAEVKEQPKKRKKRKETPINELMGVANVTCNSEVYEEKKRIRREAARMYNKAYQEHVARMRKKEQVLERKIAIATGLSTLGAITSIAGFAHLFMWVM